MLQNNIKNATAPGYHAVQTKKALLPQGLNTEVGD